MTFPLSKREYVAALIMQGTVANADLLAAAEQTGQANGIPVDTLLAHRAVMQADALLRALSPIHQPGVTP